jgi:RNA-directed DNA polymerase
MSARFHREEFHARFCERPVVKFHWPTLQIKRGKKKLRLPESKIRSGLRAGALYAYPRAKSIRRFMDQVRRRTKRNLSLTTPELIEKLNPLLRGWVKRLSVHQKT